MISFNFLFSLGSSKLLGVILAGRTVGSLTTGTDWAVGYLR